MTGDDALSYCFRCMSSLEKKNGVCPSCGYNNAVRSNHAGELPFSLIADRKYTVGKALGRGGFGITYVGLNNQLGKRVAIKEYFPAEICERAGDGFGLRAASPEVARRFEEGKQKVLREARIIARMEDISNIVRIHDCLSENNTVYIVMEFIEGETLAERVARSGAMAWPEAWRTLEPIGLATNQMHAKGMIHRDISPDNIMIRKDNGESVLLDFGAASAMLLDGKKHANLMKEGYAAPEHYKENSVIDGRSDEYAWCATLYFALTGSRPEGAMQRAYAPGCTTPPGKLCASLPAEADRLLMKGMSVAPTDRYETLGELVRLMRPYAGRRQKKGWRVAVRGIAIAAAAVCALTVGLGAMGGERRTPQVGRTAEAAMLYDAPGVDNAHPLDRRTYFSVIKETRKDSTVWYQVRVPVDGVLQTGYLNAGDTELLNDGSRLEMLNAFRN